MDNFEPKFESKEHDFYTKEVARAADDHQDDNVNDTADLLNFSSTTNNDLLGSPNDQSKPATSFLVDTPEDAPSEPIQEKKVENLLLDLTPEEESKPIVTEALSDNLHHNVDQVLENFETNHISEEPKISPVPEDIEYSPETGEESNDLENIGDDENTDSYGRPLTIPRAPTPPKELEEEGEYKPETIDLGPQKPSHHFSSVQEPHKPIIKTAYMHEKAWVDFKSINPKVMDILYWRDTKKSGIALGVSLLTLLLLTKFNIITLFAYASLFVLSMTIGFRVFKAAEAKFKSGDGANPWNHYLTEQFTIPSDKVHAQVDILVEQTQTVVAKLQKLFLVENLCKSVQFGLLLWALTYVPFTLLCLSFFVVIGAFTIPKIYEVYQEPIDANINLVKEKLHELKAQAVEKVPALEKVFSCCSAPVVEEEKKEQ